MVEDDHDGADHPLVVVLPFILGQRVTDEVAYGLGTAAVTLLSDGFIELFEKLGFQGNPDACYAVHGIRYPVTR